MHYDCFSLSGTQTSLFVRFLKIHSGYELLPCKIDVILILLAGTVTTVFEHVALQLHHSGAPDAMNQLLLCNGTVVQ